MSDQIQNDEGSNTYHSQDYAAEHSINMAEIKILEMKINKLEERLNNQSSQLTTLSDVVKNQSQIIQNLTEKKVSNSYANTVLSKIEILKHIIISNIGNSDQFISSDLINVESIETQIKETGKISENQFTQLNEIYMKQKRIKN